MARKIYVTSLVTPGVPVRLPNVAVRAGEKLSLKARRADGVANTGKVYLAYSEVSARGGDWPSRLTLLPGETVVLPVDDNANELWLDGVTGGDGVEWFVTF